MQRGDPLPLAAGELSGPGQTADAPIAVVHGAVGARRPCHLWDRVGQQAELLLAATKRILGQRSIGDIHAGTDDVRDRTVAACDGVDRPPHQPPFTRAGEPVAFVLGRKVATACRYQGFLDPVSFLGGDQHLIEDLPPDLLEAVAGGSLGFLRLNWAIRP